MKKNRYIMSRDQMRTVWNNADWQRIIDIFGLEIDQRRRSKADELWIKSPFTNENNASVHLHLTKNIFKDFSSQKGAQKGILSFCQELLLQKGLPLNCYEVAEWMVNNGIASLPIEEPDKNVNNPNAGLKIRDEKEKKGLSVKCPGNRSIKVDLRPWLQCHHPELERRGISKTTCRYLGCGYLPIRNGKTKHSPLNGRIVFQVRGIGEERNGLKPTILTHVGRALTAEEEKSNGKYWSYPFQKRFEIYNQDKLLWDGKAQEQIKKFGLILVEGFFDVASLIESGCLNVGGLMGVQISTMQIARLKFIDAHVQMRKIKVFLDRDVAGVEGAQKALSLLKSNGFQVDIFNWDQIICRSQGTSVKIPENIKDASDMSAKQLQWLRENGTI
jgi:DNA primase